MFVFVLRLFYNARRAHARRLGLASGKSSVRGAKSEGGSKPPTPARVLAILGSGGHTAEMLNMVSDLSAPASKDNATATVMYATSDDASLRKALRAGADASAVHLLPRARHVGESFWRALPRSVHCLLRAFALLLRTRPTVVLCNGPATGACVCLAAVACNAAGLLRARVIYAESVARVDSLSLSGRLLYPVVDRFLVQWQQLANRYPMAEFRGRFT